jgi:hypothetical protein
MQAGASFYKVTLDLGKSPQATEVVLDAGFGEIQRGPTGGDDLPSQR